MAISSCHVARGYECIRKPKSGCLRGWLSEAKEFLSTLTYPLLCHHHFSVSLQIYNLLLKSRQTHVHTAFSFTFILPPTEIIRAERINVRDVSSNAATLHWRAVLSGLTGHYEVRFGPLPTGGAEGGGVDGAGTSPSTGGSQYQRLIQSADSSTARLTGLKPDTTYKATLTPESNEQSFNTLFVTFTTKPGWVTSFLHVVSKPMNVHLLCYLMEIFHFGWL